MRKIKTAIVGILSIAILSSCSFKNAKAQTVPDIDQIKRIIKLTTVKVSYNNLAKSVKLKPTGLTHIGEKDRPFWVEYTGNAYLGVDLAKVNIKQEGKKIIVSIPDAEIIGSPSIDEKTFDEKSYVLSKDSINSNPITMEDQKAAISDAQNKMKENILANESLRNKAKNEAKAIIKKYVEEIGNGMYTCEFIDAK